MLSRNWGVEKMKRIFKHNGMNLLLLGISLLLFLTNCTLPEKVRGTYSSIRQDIRGNHYLKNKKYKEGIAVFQEQLKTNPDSPEVHYYMGRFQLAEKNNERALYHLDKATRLSPDNADYHFWLGVTYAANNNNGLERKCYLRALELDKKHVQALTYLGHNQLEKREYHDALRTYQRVLELEPDNPSALYNRGLILKRLKRTPEEKLAWKKYLHFYPSGPMARYATYHLNALGDFEYRNHLIGKRTVTLRKICFDPFSSKISEGSYPSLDLLGNILKNNPRLSIHVVTYQKKDKKLAEKRAKSIKRYLLRNYPEITSSQIVMSWFDVPEKINVGNKKYTKEESVHFFTAIQGNKIKKRMSFLNKNDPSN
jgi:tetratricopeptide (TPR) repeat protein